MKLILWLAARVQGPVDRREERGGLACVDALDLTAPNHQDTLTRVSAASSEPQWWVVGVEPIAKAPRTIGRRTPGRAK